MNPGQDFVNKLALIKGACGVSHAEFLIVHTTYRENNWYTDHEIQREVVGEPVAEHLQALLPAITKQAARQSLERLLAEGLLRRRSGKDVGARSDGYSLTPKGVKLGEILDEMWREVHKPDSSDDCAKTVKTN